MEKPSDTSLVETPTPEERLLSVEQFAEFIQSNPRWVRDHLAIIPGVIRYSRKMVRIDVQRYLKETHSK